MGLLDKLESYEDSQSRKYFKYAEHENKTMLIEYKGYDPEHPGYQGQRAPHVHVNLTILEPDGTLSEYHNQWIKGAVVVSFLSERQVGEVFIRKLVQLPQRPGQSNRPWAFNGTDQESFDKLKAQIAAREGAVEEALKGDDVPPWLQDGEG